ncbi:aldehyde dehydrogenase family protein, partial [Klebsiella pneumoniae]|nr:aldehyde dehydrogenase family protein [Klebsiella pneumoniae]
MAAPATGHVIAGTLVEGEGRRIDVLNPATEEVIASVPAGTPADVDAAVAAARSAFEQWAATPLERRIEGGRRISEGIAQRRD